MELRGQRFAVNEGHFAGGQFHDAGMMTVPCPECGAVDCEECFHRFLALEYTDAQYGGVHHLTVPTYMLQHPSRLSREGWTAMRATLRAFLEQGLAPQAYRTQMHDQVDSGRRTMSFSKGPRRILPEGFTWSMTIAAVEALSPEQYCQQIETWARSVLADAETI